MSVLEKEHAHIKLEHVTCEMTSEQRRVANNIISSVICMDHPGAMYADMEELNKNDSARATFLHARNIVENLLHNKRNHVKDTWQWRNPFPVRGPDGSCDMDIDHHNLGFASYLRKGKVIIAEMTPDEFMRLAQRSFGDPHFSIVKYERYRDSMMRGEAFPTPYLTIGSNGHTVTSHEGAHRAMAARDAGICTIPVYLYLYKTDAAGIPEIRKTCQETDMHTKEVII